ncbi:hypothetical protein J31TS4_40020 [Paenibacillus sp. J31TS4]|uniref:DUF962 domain-containing protein n=1 Tax=Paenibacillus sp. J31TS4 TaxID=2807195 RepID=UPI001AFD7794|nr:DUF962 domain-containing protein [Paenibacillus sp. J31TS4]GIP40722.1 hypothetical protein J31TS4_40020 [Paenibacillus sp. J31TS4]
MSVKRKWAEAIRRDLQLYMRAHQNCWNQRLHYVAFLAALVAWICLFLDMRWTVALAFVHYVCAWVGHFGFENNHPAAFRYPWVGFYAGFLWFFLRTYELVTRRRVLPVCGKNQEDNGHGIGG